MQGAWSLPISKNMIVLFEIRFGVSDILIIKNFRFIFSEENVQKKLFLR